MSENETNFEATDNTTANAFDRESNAHPLVVRCSGPNDQDDLMLEFLKSGLPKMSNHGSGKSVVVVGAGISGLIGEFYSSF